MVGLAAGIGTVLAACGPSDAQAEDRIQVVVSMSVIGDLVEQVAGEHADVRSLVPIGGDPHVHQPTPSDARAIADADVVLANGAGLEPWFDTLVAGADRKASFLTTDLDHVLLDEQDGVSDPHLWMVPPYVEVYVQTIAQHLAEADPDNAEAYRSNALVYRDELAALDHELKERLSRIPQDHRVLVTSHDAYRYFAEHYGLKVVPVIGVTTEEEPSAARVRDVVDVIRAQQVPTVFVETTINPAVMERIARDAGVSVGDPLYGDSIGEQGSGADSYIGMMRANVEAITVGLAAS